MLDSVCEQHGDRVAPVQWQVYSQYPLYCAEGLAKLHLYPFYDNLIPMLCVDGVDWGHDRSAWRGYVSTRMLVPSDVSLAHVGTTYDPATRDGQVQVECYNAGGDPIDAALQVAITEDSVKYTGPPYYDSLYNHVCRDYVPGQNGTPVTLPVGGYDTVTVPYSLDSTWVEEQVKLVVYLQNMTAQPDSTMPCYQGLQTRLPGFTAVEEPKTPQASRLTVNVSPNPCRAGCEFTLSCAAAHGARITVYTPDGRLVSSLRSVGNRAAWSRNGAARGIYLYRVNAGTATTHGKLVVTD